MKRLAALLLFFAAAPAVLAEGPPSPPPPAPGAPAAAEPHPLPPEPAHGAEITAAELLWADAWLADDARKGRETGTPECREAAEWIAGRMKTMGLEKVPGAEGWFQHWPLRSAVSEAAFEVSSGEGEKRTQVKLAIDADFRPLEGTAEGEVEAPVVFAGYGIRAGEYAYNDFAGIDAKGKVALILRHEPREQDPKARWNGDKLTPHSQFLKKVQAAEEAGAAAVVFVNDPLHHEKDSLDAGGVGGGAKIPVVFAKRAAADAILASAGTTLAELQKRIDDADAPASLDVPGARVRIRVRLKTIQSENVLGMVRGVDPTLRDEWVVVGAHYDHVGLGMGGGLDPKKYGQVHNGADDNASGTSAMLEIAEHFSLSKERTRRSLLFLAFSGEEKGLLGSRWYATHPLIPNEKVVAMVNLDMVGRYRPGQLEVVGAACGSTFKGIIDRANEGIGLEYRHTNEGMANSDGLPFHDAKVPTVFFFTGLHGDYHRPADDWWLLNAEGAAKVASLAARTVRGLADADGRPAFTPIPRGEMIMGGSRPRLGVFFDENATAEGATLSRLMPSGAAAKAGLKAGDRIVSFGGERVKTHQDVIALLAKVKPGDRVAVKAVRLEPAAAGEEKAPAEKTLEFTVEFPAAAAVAVGPAAPRIGITASADPDPRPGVAVIEVAAEGPAGSAGLKAGDRILSYRGEKVTDYKTLSGLLLANKPGETLVLVVLREGKEQEIKVTLPK